LGERGTNGGLDERIAQKGDRKCWRSHLVASSLFRTSETMTAGAAAAIARRAERALQAQECVHVRVVRRTLPHTGRLQAACASVAWPIRETQFRKQRILPHKCVLLMETVPGCSSTCEIQACFPTRWRGLEPA